MRLLTIKKLINIKYKENEEVDYMVAHNNNGADVRHVTIFPNIVSRADGQYAP
jgi:hypothetical protein